MRLGPGGPVPGWALDSGGGPLHSVVRTRDELSVVCPQSAVPTDVHAERGWRAIAVAGPFDLALTGILAAICVPLAEARVALFAVSTYDTDYVLVPGGRLADAAAALRGAGHDVSAPA